ncbi:excinuclease ABC subunit UvrC [Anaerocolumna sp.]|uniref:excinuclease ABC subunit UvrC n=1 Tax=Anaerocolumna sp. TaxID=2041569 RepID=UPI0028AA2D89|nr:excinuclease ABC subunit UvrC [Anaerocolumna sp.]
MFFDIEEELKKLPAKPGVYIMHDSNDTIIYVGKAISLKNRVRQYFQSSRNLTPKIQQMVSHINYFEYIITDSELEALVLECNLIKEHRPKYNTMLKDDKSYPYIKVTVNEAYPRVLFARQRGKDKAKYFGPYTSSKSIKDTLELLRKIYFIRTCNRNLPKDVGKDRPCLYYHIKQCKAPCQGYVSEEEYKESIQKVLEFLNGNYSLVTKELEGKMKQAAANLEFENAAEYRDLLNSVMQIAQKQKITSSELEDRDIVALATAGNEAVVQVFFIRSGKLIGRDHFYLTGVEHETKSSILTSFVKQFYAGTPLIPRELILGEPIEEQEIIEEWLASKRGQKVYIKVPIKGEKERLVELARKNASLVLQQDAEKIKREEARTVGAIKQIGELLNIPGIRRIESFDISNTSGFESVGSMVVYENGKPKRNDYRKFKIRSVKGPDDYASMEEVLTRRLTHAAREQNALLQGHGSYENIGLSGESGSHEEYAAGKGRELDEEQEFDGEQRLGGKQELGEDQELDEEQGLVGEQKLPEGQEFREKNLNREYDSFNKLPDLIMMDGGKGQVNIAKKVLNDLNMAIPVCGMVKDDNHRTRGLYYNNTEIPIDTHSEAFRLITRIQDETHRFAIEYHKLLRGKAQIHSVLDDIKGVGAARRKALMKHFQSIEAIKEASVEELAAVASMNKPAAEKVYEFFHS